MALRPGDVANTLDSIQPEQFATDAARYEVTEAARRLVARLETPLERAVNLTWSDPVLFAGVALFQDLGVWKKLTAENKLQGKTPQSLEKIVNMCDVPVEPNLLRRFLRHLAASYTLEETAVDEWNLTPFTLAMGDESVHVDQVLAFGRYTISAALNLPPFLAKNEYREPLNPAKFDNYSDVFGAPFFDHLQKNPSVGASFAGLMTGLRNYKMDWTDVYDTSKLVEGTDFSTSAPPFFVDIGGLHGLDTARLLSKQPELPTSARLVVQDLPEVVSAYQEATQEVDPRISRMAYDFFTPQVLTGARAYFFHAVPHDWPDAECIRIFENVKAAMKKGYSKLLIYEMVIPVQGAAKLMTTLDLELMSCLSGMERTEEQWRKLLGGLGFNIVSISRHPRAVESVIEVEL